MDEITIRQRKELRARAHNLNPILQLGEKGLTDAVIAEIDRALAAHELIKVRAAPLNRDERDVALACICERTNAHAVQHIGKMLIVYRKKPEEPQKPTRTARPGSRTFSPRRESPRPPRRRPPSRSAPWRPARKSRSSRP